MSCYFSMDDMLCLWRLGKLAINVLMNPYVDYPGSHTYVVSHLGSFSYKSLLSLTKRQPPPPAPDASARHSA